MQMSDQERLSAIKNKIADALILLHEAKELADNGGDSLKPVRVACTTVISNVIRYWSETSTNTISASVSQLKARGVSLGDSYKRSRCKQFNKWCDNRRKEVNDDNVDSAKALVYAMGHTCTGKKSNNIYMTFEEFSKKCAKHYIIVSKNNDHTNIVDTIDDVLIRGNLTNDKIKFISSMTLKICKKCPLYYEHYLPVDDVKTVIASAVSNKRFSHHDLRKFIVGKLDRMLTCWVTVFENSNITHQYARVNPWDDYSNANITICNPQTGEVFKDQRSLIDHASKQMCA